MNKFKIGDKVEFTSLSDINRKYIFTIELIDFLFIWGSEIPEQYKYTYGMKPNYHSPDYCTLVNINIDNIQTLEF